MRQNVTEDVHVNIQITAQLYAINANNDDDNTCPCGCGVALRVMT
jgi:hypothetical protein